MFSDDDIEPIRNAVAFGQDGLKIGPVGDVYLDDANGRPSWVTVVTGLFGSRVHFAPLTGALLDGDKLVLAHSRVAVLAAPRIAEDEHLSANEEATLLSYYARTPQPADVPEPAPEAEAGQPPAEEQTQPAPVGDEAQAGSLEDRLEATQQLTQEARVAAEKADPLRDGSYAGDSAKAPLIDTPDLEAHEHGWARLPDESEEVVSETRLAEEADLDAEGELDSERRDRDQVRLKEGHRTDQDPELLPGEDGGL